MTALVAAAFTPLSARMAERVGARLLITTGLVCMTAGLAILAVVPSTTPVWALAALMVLVGVAGPLVTAAGSLLLRTPTKGATSLWAPDGWLFCLTTSGNFRDGTD
ncbi:MAG: transporter, family, methylenomycin resistance protein [Actinomycetota bacterium]|jgi:MFS family permease|nr:transporter, family, methylenomycin resistance protein [Actinomycetota bacterium]